VKLALAVFAMLTGAVCGAQTQQDDLAALDRAFAKGVVVVHASENACHLLEVYVAQSPAQHARGLMRVRNLPSRTGMLFIYETDGYLSMWMKNTFIPLDMLFIRADGTVSSVAYRTEPQSLESIAALEPVRYVLELNAGMAEKLSIDKYSRIEWDGMPRDE
jgi:uncharacterized membrane protein (UPF0127 family)